MMGEKILALLPQPIKSKLKPNASRLNAFFRAWRQQHVFFSCHDRLIGLPASVVISWSDHFVFNFTTLN